MVIIKLINRDTDYAVRTLVYLGKNEGKKATITDIVEELDISRAFLRKIMQVLAKRNIIESYKSNKGGFKLKKSLSDINLIDLIEIFQGGYRLNECIFNKKICPNRNTCLLKKKVDLIEDMVKKELYSINLGSLVAQ